MSVFMISFFLSLGTAVWLYNKFAKRSGGGNIQPAIIGASVTGVVLFIIVFLTLSTVLN